MQYLPIIVKSCVKIRQTITNHVSMNVGVPDSPVVIITIHLSIICLSFMCCFTSLYKHCIAYFSTFKARYLKIYKTMLTFRRCHAYEQKNSNWKHLIIILTWNVYIFICKWKIKWSITSKTEYSCVQVSEAVMCS